MFTASVKAVQARRGSRAAYARVEASGGFENPITDELALFVGERDSAYLATASMAGRSCSTAEARRASSGSSTTARLGRVSRKQAVHHDGQPRGERPGLPVPDGLRAPREGEDLGPGAGGQGRSGARPAPHVRGLPFEARQAVLFAVEAWDVNCPPHRPAEARRGRGGGRARARSGALSQALGDETNGCEARLRLSPAPGLSSRAAEASSKRGPCFLMHVRADLAVQEVVLAPQLLDLLGELLRRGLELGELGGRRRPARRGLGLDPCSSSGTRFLAAARRGPAPRGAARARPARALRRATSAACRFSRLGARAARPALVRRSVRVPPARRQRRLAAAAPSRSSSSTCAGRAAISCSSRAAAPWSRPASTREPLLGARALRGGGLRRPRGRLRRQVRCWTTRFSERDLLAEPRRLLARPARASRAARPRASSFGPLPLRLRPRGPPRSRAAPPPPRGRAGRAPPRPARRAARPRARAVSTRASSPRVPSTEARPSSSAAPRSADPLIGGGQLGRLRVEGVLGRDRLLVVRPRLGARAAQLLLELRRASAARGALLLERGDARARLLELARIACARPSASSTRARSAERSSSAARPRAPASLEGGDRGVVLLLAPRDARPAAGRARRRAR